MALGGGTWLVQNKVLPGSYINFSSIAKASATLSDRGYAAAPFELSWGPENEVFAVTSGEFQKNSKAIFGYSYDHPKMLALREIFLHATTVYCYRLGLGAVKASATAGGLRAIAKCPGVRGNDIAISVAANVDDPGMCDVTTYLDGIAVDTQTAARAADLAGNSYVDFSSPIVHSPDPAAVSVAQPAQSDDLLGKRAGDLQSDITIRVMGTTAYVFGTLRYVKGFGAFNEKTPAEQSGNYFAVKIAEDYTKFSLMKDGAVSKSDLSRSDDLVLFRVGSSAVTHGITLDDGKKRITFDFRYTGFETEDGTVIRAEEQLTPTAGAPLTGGADVEAITGDSHQAFLDKIEPYAFNAMCCPAADPTIVKLYAAYTERMRDEVGAKFQLVAWQPSTVDYEGVIGVWNTATHPTIENVDEHAIVYWATGAHAGVAVNKSLTNAKYDGELVLNTQYTNAEYTAAIKAGKFMFYNDNGTTRILEDINTLLTLSDTKGEDFQSCQTMRVCDQIANDVAVLFGTRYLGTVQNDASGRSAFWGDIVHYMGDLEKIRAVENFDPDTVACEQGDKKKAVLLTMNGLNIVNAMAQLYMSVIIR